MLLEPLERGKCSLGVLVMRGHLDATASSSQRHEKRRRARVCGRDGLPSKGSFVCPNHQRRVGEYLGLMHAAEDGLVPAVPLSVALPQTFIRACLFRRCGPKA